MLALESLPDSKIPCEQLSRHSISNSAEHLNASIQKPQKNLDAQMDNVWDLISKADIVNAEMRTVKYQLLFKTLGLEKLQNKLTLLADYTNKTIKSMELLLFTQLQMLGL